LVRKYLRLDLLWKQRKWLFPLFLSSLLANKSASSGSDFADAGGHRYFSGAVLWPRPLKGDDIRPLGQAIEQAELTTQSRQLYSIGLIGLRRLGQVFKSLTRETRLFFFFFIEHNNGSHRMHWPYVCTVEPFNQAIYIIQSIPRSKCRSGSKCASLHYKSPHSCGWEIKCTCVCMCV
jgi:hypothetical protein